MLEQDGQPTALLISSYVVVKEIFLDLSKKTNHALSC